MKAGWGRDAPDTGCRLARVGLLGVLLAAPLALALLVLHPGVSGATLPACTISWTSPASGSWNTAANWDQNRVPTNADDVCIASSGSYTVTATGTLTVDSLTLGGGTGTQVLQLDGCSGGTAFTTSSASIPDTVLSSGMLVMTDTDACTGDKVSFTTVSSLSSAGVIESDAGAGGQRSLTGDLTNTGVVKINTTTTFASGHVWDNSGPLNMADGTVLTLAPSTSPISTFINDAGGSVNSSGPQQSGNLLLQAGNTFNQGAGTTSGSPVVVLSGTTLFQPGGGTATIWSEGSGSLQGTINAGQTFQIEGVGSGGPAATVSVSQPVTVNGTIDLNSGGFFGAPVALNSQVAPLTIGATGVLQSDAGAGGSRNLSGSITTAAGGAVNINVGTNWSTGTFVNRGTVAIADKVTFLIPSTTPASTFNNASTGNIVTSAANTAGNLFMLGNIFIEAGQTTGTPIFIDGTSLRYKGTGASSITAWGSSTLSGPVSPGQILTVQAVGCVADAMMSDSSNLAVNGTLVLSSSNCHGGSAGITMTGPAGSNTITVGTTGTFTWAAGSGGNRLITGNLASSGLIGPNGISKLTVNGAFIQRKAGTLRLSVGSAVSGSAVSDTIVASGKASLAGQLVVVPVNGFTPAHGTVWKGVIQAGSRVGSFQTTTGPGGTWKSAVSGATVNLTFV